MKPLDYALKRTHYKKFKEKVLFLHQIIFKWFEENKRDFPWRKKISWQKGLVTELLLQRTRATKVEEVFHDLFEKYPDFSALCKAKREDLEQIILILGLQEQRSERLIQIACKLKNKRTKPTQGELKDLPGVGDYVGNATLCFYLGESRPLLDTNFRRVYSRYFDVEISPTLKQKKAYEFVEKIIPENNCDIFSYSILDLAFYICKFNIPNCLECPLNSTCSYSKRISKLKKKPII